MHTGSSLFTSCRHVYEVCVGHGSVQPGSPGPATTRAAVISKLHTGDSHRAGRHVRGEIGCRPPVDKTLRGWLLTLGLAAAFGVSGLIRPADPGCPGQADCPAAMPCLHYMRVSTWAALGIVMGIIVMGTRGRGIGSALSVFLHKGV